MLHHRTHTKQQLFSSRDQARHQHQGGCGTSAFVGKISSLGCGDNTGTFTVSATGNKYLVVKCGGEDLKIGISVDNIEVRGQ